IGEQSAVKDAGLAFEIWFALERRGKVPPVLTWDPVGWLSGRVAPLRLFAGIEARLLRERAYTMLRERRDDWAEIYVGALMQETEPSAIERMVEVAPHAAA